MLLCLPIFFRSSKVTHRCSRSHFYSHTGGKKNNLCTPEFRYVAYGLQMDDVKTQNTSCSLFLDVFPVWNPQIEAFDRIVKGWVVNVRDLLKVWRKKRKKKRKNDRWQLFTGFKVPLRFAIAAVLQQCILHSSNHMFGLQLEWYSRECDHVRPPRDTLWSFNRRHLMSEAPVEPDGRSITFPQKISFRMRDGNTWEQLMTCWHKGNQEECLCFVSKTDLFTAILSCVVGNTWWL